MSNIDHQRWARQFLAFLVDHVLNFQGGNKLITYGDLAKQTGYPEPHTGSLFGRNIGITLGAMGHLFEKVFIDGDSVPLIMAIVVSKVTNLPSDGLKEFSITYPKLSTMKKRDFLQSECAKVFGFGSRWNVVLNKLNVKPLRLPAQPGGNIQSSRYNPYGGEGSPEHIALRKYVISNPAVVGIDPAANGIPEYPLKSGDQVDVLFELPQERIGVEVKSRRSDDKDIERGLYQCIKYSAVLEAENKAERSPEPITIKCILAIENEFPRILQTTKRKLGVDVYEKIVPVS